MRGVPAWHQPHSVQHPSTVLALRANPPSPTGGEGRALSGRTEGREGSPLLSFCAAALFG
ncbi:MAG: hypothetical protein EOS11_10255 [Mesorhizobium sp.]|nr:MAG: hypothetical protein EOS11_10255 [Mesorhizobium sp.]TIN77799.1 MAG: hypothetical protein E5Y09_16700 [Mesorhizobium sp.]